MAREERELTDARWAVLKPLLPPQRPTTGRPNKDHRQVLEAIVWLLRTGAPWRDLPDSFGPWRTVASRAWQTARGKRTAAGVVLGRSRGGLSSKLHLLVEGGGRPLVILVTAGQRHEAPLLPALLDAGAVKRSGPAGRPGRGRPRKWPEQLAADKGYSYPSVRAELRRRGIAAVIPTRSNQRRRREFDRAVYAGVTGWSAA